MEATLRVFSLVINLIVVSLLAYRWVILSHDDELKKRGKKITFIIVAWAGVFALGTIQTRISIAYFNPADFPEDLGLPADVAYDSVGNNVFALFFGLILVLTCIGIAKLFKPKQVEQHRMKG